MTTGGSDGLLVVLLNSMQASHTSLHDSSTTTPHIDNLSDSATVYRRAVAPTSGLVSSTTSLLTGIPAHNHRLTEGKRLIPGHTFIEDINPPHSLLIDADNLLTQHDNGLTIPFDKVIDTPDEYADAYDTRTLQDGPDGFWYANQFDQWLSNRDDDWAAVISLADAERCFEPRNEYAPGDDEARDVQQNLPELWEYAFRDGTEPLWKLGALERLHKASVKQVDAVFGALLDAVKDRTDYANTTVIVTSPRGIGFGEEAPTPSGSPAVGCLPSVHEAALHVPLAVKAGSQTESHVVDSTISLTGISGAIPKMMADDTTTISARPPVVASSHKPSRQHVEEARERGLPIDVFGPGRAAYFPATTVPPAVTKYEQWGDSGVVQTIYDDGAAVVEGGIDPGVIDGFFEDEQEDITEIQSDVDGADDLLIDFEET